MNFNQDIVKYVSNFTDYGKSAIQLLLNKNYETDKQILDPLTTVIKIALLYFYTDGTKLSICDNTINIQEYNNFQGLIRWIYGDSRDKLYNLKEPIKNCLKWFPYSKYKNLKVIYTYAILGLEKLKSSYTVSTTNITIHIIEYYIKIIRDNLDELKLKINDTGKIINMEKSIILNDKLQRDIKHIWTKTDISLINNFFEILIIRKKNSKNIDNVFLSLLEFLKEKDNKIKNYIKKYTTELSL